MDAYFTDELGWTNLNNTAAVVEAGGLRLETFGVSDAHREWDDLTALPAAIAAARRGRPFHAARDADLVIGVTHAPYQRVLDRFVEAALERPQE